MDDTCDKLGALTLKEESDKKEILKTLDQVEGKLMDAIAELRSDMDNNFKDIRDDCDTFSKRLTVQKGEATSHGEQLKTTNITMRRIDDELQTLIREVEGGGDDE